MLSPSHSLNTPNGIKTAITHLVKVDGHVAAAQLVGDVDGAALEDVALPLWKVATREHHIKKRKRAVLGAAVLGVLRGGGGSERARAHLAFVLARHLHLAAQELEVHLCFVCF